MTETESHPDETTGIKVRIAACLPTVSDYNVFTGKVSTQFPYKPCAPAIGLVSRDYPEYSLKIGDKVIINPYSINENGNVAVEGNLCDFAILPPDKVVPYPQASVTDDEAIFCDYLSIALKTVSQMNIKKGEYVAILGGSVIANITAQLVKYFQGIPIYITGDVAHINVAEKCGIRNIINEREEEVLTSVANVSGGRLADKTLLFCDINTTPHRLLSLLKDNGNAYIVATTQELFPLETDISLIAKKNVKITGIMLGANDFEPALNFLVQKVVDLSNFIDCEYTLTSAPVLFDEIAKSPDLLVCPIIRNDW
jgi:threonine dehydrogenase-like Zn-dependent dehydrogenase